MYVYLCKFIKIPFCHFFFIFSIDGMGEISPETTSPPASGKNLTGEYVHTCQPCSLQQMWFLHYSCIINIICDTHSHYIQWNLCTKDTTGTSQGLHTIEVSLEVD